MKEKNRARRVGETLVSAPQIPLKVSLGAINVIQAVGDTLKALGKWDEEELYLAGQDIVETIQEGAKTVDHGVNFVTGLIREMIGAVLQGKGYVLKGIAKSKYVNKKDARRYGKMRRRPLKRSLLLADGVISTAGSLAVGTLDSINSTVGKSVDLIAERETHSVKRLDENIGNARVSVGKEIRDTLYGTIMGKELRDHKHHNYIGSARDHSPDLGPLKKVSSGSSSSSKSRTHPSSRSRTHSNYKKQRTTKRRRA